MFAPHYRHGREEDDTGGGGGGRMKRGVLLHGGTIQPRGSKPALLNSLLSLRRPG